MISALPDSVRVRLYFFCDDEDLISIGLTNRQNNQLAIGYLLSKSCAVFSGASTYVLIGLMEKPRCPSKALHFAFFLNPHIHQMEYSVMPVGREGISQDLRHVQRFLSRCRTLTTLEFHFEEMEKMLGGSEVAEEALGLGDAGGWLEVLANVLSLAVNKQCETIGMVGVRMIGLVADFGPVSRRAQAALDGSDPDPAAPAGDGPTAVAPAIGYPAVCDIQDGALAGGTPAHPTPTDPDIEDGAFADGRLVDATPADIAPANLSDPIGFSANVVWPESNPIGVSAPTTRAEESTQEEVVAVLAAPRAQSHPPAAPRVDEKTTSQSRLKVLKMESAIFFQSPVIDWLVDAISSSPNLEEITFSNVYSKPAIWDRVVNSITRPNLHTFCVGHNWLIFRETGLSLSTLYHFLLRHPKLKVLKLYGLEMTAELSLFTSPQAPICPNLTKLACHPLLAAAILTDRGASSGIDWSYSSLTSIALYSEEYLSTVQRQNFSPDLFDSALMAMGQTKRLPTALELELYIADNRSVTLNDWLQKHITMAHRGTGSCIAKLTMVNSFIMRGGVVDPDIQDRTFELLPAFVDLFPTVQHLGLVKMYRSPELWAGVQRDPTEGFEMVLATACPRLVSFKKDGSKKVFLDNLRGSPKDIGKKARIGDAGVSGSSDLVIGV